MGGRRRELLLLRHAKSSWDEPALDDRDRPLAPRGRRACGLMARHLEASGIEPDGVVCSPAVRALQTLEGIRPALGDRTAFWEEPGIYDAGWEELLGIVRALPAELGSAMLIGHNPGFQELAVALAAGGEGLERIRRKFPTAALATFSFADQWEQLGPHGAVLESFVRPKQLG
jgi:phosphohistidine phosphatase